MRPRTVAIRFLCVSSLAVWMGGFTFYGSVVVPILHDVLTHDVAGSITRRVTDALNLFGVATLAVWWAASWAERSAGSRGLRAMRFGLLALISGLLAALFVLHTIMDERLDSGSLRDFYPLHRWYLRLSTAQWVLSLLLLVVALMIWGGPGAGQGEGGESLAGSTERPSPGGDACP